MTSTTLTVWQQTTTTATVTHRPCAAAQAMLKVYFRGLCIDGDDGP